MTKINQEEYEVLKGLDDKWKWIARDIGGDLLGFLEKPTKGNRNWRDENNDFLYFAAKDWKKFQFIQWADEEPYSIAALIEEYEEAMSEAVKVLVTGIRNYFQTLGDAFQTIGKRFSSLGIESEGTEVKTLESIREEIWEEMLRLEDKRKDQWADIKYQTLREVLQKLGHLDEPEVLSQEWIERKYFNVDNLLDEYENDGDKSPDHTPQIKVIALQDLQNLLVPKESLGNSQELGKVQIPQFVADWLEEYKEDELIITAGTVIGNRRFPKDTKVARWLNEDYVKNSEIFAQAWLTYPNIEVEEEQKYYAKIKGWELFVDFVGTQYWGVVSNYGRLGFVSIDGAKERTKEEWNELGINEDNADFVKVEELEE